ncbi:hypothetical protein EDD15DRAFT_2205358 [Pisolithus albus]|nr:hypothetical protein EDD15DRAFT_2205358 [Pisolithus albus]
MTVPRVMKCPDNHFHCVICGIGLYIADYPEQVLISGIVQNWCGRCTASPNDLDAGRPPHTAELMRAVIEELQASAAWDEWGIDANVVPFTEDFPRADICRLLAPDILHQLIKGGFKDHLVEWVGKYLELVYGKAGAKERLADIDCRIAAAPPFPGLRRFPDGRGFSQWTGDDSKALMKVYLPAIEGHVPSDIVHTFRAFLEFCYIVRQNVITEDMLSDLKMALDRFHRYREIFRDVGVIKAHHQQNRLFRTAATATTVNYSVITASQYNSSTVAQSPSVTQFRTVHHSPSQTHSSTLPHWLHEFTAQHIATEPQRYPLPLHTYDDIQYTPALWAPQDALYSLWYKWHVEHRQAAASGRNTENSQGNPSADKEDEIVQQKNMNDTNAEFQPNCKYQARRHMCQVIKPNLEDIKGVTTVAISNPGPPVRHGR